MIANHFVSKASFELGGYEEAAREGRAAFNLCTIPRDMLACALLGSTGYYEIKDYAKGYSLLNQMEAVKVDVDLKKLLSGFPLAMKDDDEAIRHATELYQMNEKAGDEPIVRFLRASA